MRFAELLGQCKEESGLSYQQLAERSYVDVAYIHRLVASKATRPSRDVVLRLAIALGLSLEQTDELLRTAGHLPLVRSFAVIPIQAQAA